jgi:hypothetical protein
MRRRTGRLAVAAAVAALAGCGGDEGPDLDRLEDGRAAGPGFSFRLSGEWRAALRTWSWTPRPGG